MKSVLLILNPVAGMKKAAKNLAEIVTVFNRADYDVRVYVTGQRGDAVRAVEAIGSRTDLIVCCGGDGTLNETISGVLRCGLQIPLGYIPAGSTNDFAGSLGLSGNVTEAAKQVVNGTDRAYDVGKFQDRYFSYVASFGAFTKTSYATPQGIKNALGHMAYVLEGLQEIPKIKKLPLRMEIEGEVLEDDYLFGAVCNSTSIGGILKLNPNLVNLRDGKFEVFLVRAPKSIQELQECAKAIRSKTYDCRMLAFRSAGHIRITTDPGMSWTLDGEQAEGGEHIILENLRQRILLRH